MLIGAFGLQTLSHEDDASRGVGQYSFSFQ